MQTSTFSNVPFLRSFALTRVWLSGAWKSITGPGAPKSAEAAVEIYERLGQLEAISAASMLSDLRVGRLMAAAAARGALENVAINLEAITDAAYAATMQTRAAALEARLASSPVTAGD